MMSRFVAAHDWLGALPRSVKSEVEKRTTIRRFGAGGEIGRAGDTPHHALRLRSGYFRHTRLNADNRRASLLIYVSGHCFHEREILTRPAAPYDFHASRLRGRDAAETRLPRFPTRVTGSFLEALCTGCLRTIAKQAIAREFDQALKLRARMEEMFGEFAWRCGLPEEDGSVPFGFPLSQSDTAELLSVTRRSAPLEIAVCARPASRSSGRTGGGCIAPRAERPIFPHPNARYLTHPAGDPVACMRRRMTHCGAAVEDHGVGAVAAIDLIRARERRAELDLVVPSLDGDNVIAALAQVDLIVGLGTHHKVAAGRAAEIPH